MVAAPLIRFSAGQGRGLALMLSGLNYFSDRPLLAGVGSLMQARGYDLVTVDFAYKDDPAFMAADAPAQIEQIRADGVMLLHEILARYQARPLTVIGKSLGTISVWGMLDDLPPDTRLVWLTPSLGETGLGAAIKASGRRAFSLIGSDDLAVDETRDAAWRAAPGLTHHEIAGADHGWNTVEGGDVLGPALDALADWLDEGRG